MNLRFLFKESLTALTSAPIRSTTMLGVIIGVAAVIAMMSIGGGAKLETLRQIEALGATLFMLSHLNLLATISNEQSKPYLEVYREMITT